MLRIRLTRVGKRNKPAYRLVVAEHWRPIKGRFIEILGHYNPITKEKGFKEERIKYWLGVGAKPSITVHNLLVRAGVMVGPKISITRKKEKAGEEGEKESLKEVPKSE